VCYGLSMAEAIYIMSGFGVVLLGVLIYTLATTRKAALETLRLASAAIEGQAKAQAKAISSIVDAQRKSSSDLLKWLDENQGIGGVPRDLWLKRNELDQMRLDQQAKQLDHQLKLQNPMIQEQVRRAAEQAKVSALGRANGAARGGRLVAP